MSPVLHSVKGNLLAAFRHLLKPLVRLAIKNGVALREFSDVVKGAYVDAATKQIMISGDEASMEAIAVMLNVEQHEIRDVLASPELSSAGYEQQTTPVAKILAAWHTDPRTSGPYGVLVDLPFDAATDPAHGNAFTFTDLAKRCCPGIAPKVLLEESIRTECVIGVGNGYYRAIKRSHVPHPLSAASINHFAQVVHNVCETCERNLRGESAGGKGLFERVIYSDTRITQLDLKAFDKYVRERGQLFADDIDNWLSSRSPPSPSDQDPVNTGIGLYHFVINDDDEREFTQTRTSEGMK
jgi:hypothetical protein